jgi:hypothetical protein
VATDPAPQTFAAQTFAAQADATVGGASGPQVIRVLRSCSSCGFTGIYRTPATADYHHKRHSCAKHLAVQLRRLHRADSALRRDCAHRTARHRHGTRVAYVRDRCRCTACRAANAAASARARKSRVLGHPGDLVDAAAVRFRLHRMREAGVGIQRIAALSGIAPSHIRQLLTVRPDGTPAVARVRRRTAERFPALVDAQSVVSSRAQVAALGTARRLQALHAIGWSTTELAARLDVTTQGLRRTMTRTRVTVGTRNAVAALYEELWNVRPDSCDAAAAAPAKAARDQAQHRGWLPPLAWDDIDRDPQAPRPSGDPQQVDEIAVERALARDGISLGDLTSAEQAVVIGELTRRGKSLTDIADALTTTTRTVSRRRAAIRTAS